MDALGSEGAQVGTAIVDSAQLKKVVDLSVSAASSSQVTIREGGNEGLLIRLCAGVRVPAKIVGCDTAVVKEGKSIGRVAANNK